MLTPTFINKLERRRLKKDLGTQVVALGYLGVLFPSIFTQRRKMI